MRRSAACLCRAVVLVATPRRWIAVKTAFVATLCFNFFFLPLWT